MGREFQKETLKHKHPASSFSRFSSPNFKERVGSIASFVRSRVLSPFLDLDLASRAFLIHGEPRFRSRNVMNLIEGMESVVASVSGYHGRDRFQLIKLISCTGASYVGAMNKSTTHLVCWRFEGKKYDFARSIGAQIVSHRWFEECLKSGKRIPEGPYLMESGEEAGQILWECPATTVHGKNNQASDTENTALSDCSNFMSSSRNVKTDKRKSNVGCSDWTDSLLPGERDFITFHSEKTLKKREKSDHGSSSKDNNFFHTQNNISDVSLSEWDDESSYESFWPRARHQTSIHDFIQDNSIGKESKKKRRLVKMVSRTDGNEHISNNSNLEKNKHSEFSKLIEHKEGCSGDGLVGISTESEERYEAVLSRQRQLELSCVICWTEFSSTRGVLPCGHRFCYSCIQDWANRLVSEGKPTTCPLCKAIFIKITRVEEADTSDQKIYSQTIPSGLSSTEIFVSSGAGNHNLQTLYEEAVCYACHNHEPQDLLLDCHICHLKWVHSYCLDPPQFPWTCVDCRDLRMLYHHFH